RLMSLSLSSLFASRKNSAAARRASRRGLPDLERLEDRTVLSVTFSNPATMSGDVAVTGTDAADQFLIRLGTTAGADQTSDFVDNGQTTTAKLSGITSITVNGMGGNDQLTLDMSNGLIGAAGTALPISFNAGTSGRST